MRNFRRLTDVHNGRVHPDSQRELTNHVARLRVDHATVQNLAVTVRFRGVIKQEIGDIFLTGVGCGTARFGLGEQTLLDLDALHLGLVCGFMSFKLENLA